MCGGGGKKKEEEQQEQKGRASNIFRSPTEFPLPVVPFSHSILSVTVPCSYTPIECTLDKIQSPHNVTFPRAEHPEVYFCYSNQVPELY
jgi:hypothetical protein